MIRVYKNNSVQDYDCLGNVIGVTHVQLPEKYFAPVFIRNCSCLMTEECLRIDFTEIDSNKTLTLTHDRRMGEIIPSPNAEFVVMRFGDRWDFMIKDVTSNTQVELNHTRRRGKEFTFLAWSLDSSSFAYTNDKRDVFLVNMNDLIPLKLLTLDRFVYRGRFVQDSTLLVLINGHSLFVIDIIAGKELGRVNELDGPEDVVVSHDARIAFVFAHGYCTLKRIDLVHFREIEPLYFDTPVNHVYSNSTGSYVVIQDGVYALSDDTATLIIELDNSLTACVTEPHVILM
jgi:hypothetical protein